ncbi:hypothetical protein [Herbiconiux daphne]|uniref:Uncharacterized protein n=1 Tax=Herbiconiux daphne TaxID=2970914 RepID=A0ABT2GY65_9MICO|nr:hypothetical protein [Herbiconiux daphne]MCS5732267.1 hypothetical protein [Herbiconiux daphne]
MTDNYWTDDVTAMALVTPVDEIRLDEITSEQLRRLIEIVEDMRRHQPRDSDDYESRYWRIRRLLEENETE